MTQTILVADDSATMRTIFAMAFHGSAFHVVTVESAERALHSAYELRPAAIVLDYHLPDRSGMEVCRAIKSDPNLRNIPVMILGGKFHAFSEDEARGAGCDDVLAKPFKTDTIVERVTSLARGGASQPAAAPPRPSFGAAAPAPAQPSYGGPAAPQPRTRLTADAAETAQPSYGGPAAPQPSYGAPAPAAAQQRAPQPSFGQSRFGGAAAPQPSASARTSSSGSMPGLGRNASSGSFSPAPAQPPAAPARPRFGGGPTAAPAPQSPAAAPDRPRFGGLPRPGAPVAPSALPTPPTAVSPQAGTPTMSPSAQFRRPGGLPPRPEHPTQPAYTPPAPAPTPAPAAFTPHAPAPRPAPAHRSADSQITDDDHTPVPAPMPLHAATSPGGNAMAVAVAAAIDPEEINRLVKEEVQRAVRDQMLAMVKTVLGDLFQERMMPRLLQYGEERINTIVASDLQVIMQNAVEAELAKLTHHD